MVFDLRARERLRLDPEDDEAVDAGVGGHAHCASHGDGVSILLARVTLTHRTTLKSAIPSVHETQDDNNSN